MKIITLLAATTLGFCLSLHSTSGLADSRPGKTEIKTTLGGRAEIYPSLRNWFTAALKRDSNLVAEDRYAEAIADLRKLLDDGSLTHFEVARAQQVLSSYYWAVGDNQHAYDAIKAAVTANGLNNVEHLQAMYRAAQILTVMDRYKESAAEFDHYQQDAPNVAGSEYVLQAINYFYQMDYRSSLLYVDKAFATGEEPAANWYQFKATSLLLGGDYAGAVTYCREQMARQPNNAQWTSMLVDAYAAMEKYPEALAVMDEARAKGQLTTDAQLTQLYQLYVKAGRLLDAVAAIDAGLAAGQLHADLRTLNAKGQYLYEAAMELKGKPEAAPLLQQATAALSQAVAIDPADGNAEFWLGQIATFAQGDNGKAREYLIAATGKHLKHAGLAWYYLGGVEDHLNHETAAKTALQQALQDPESKAVAETYLKGMK